jgi:hypothetical protein
MIHNLSLLINIKVNFIFKLIKTRTPKILFNYHLVFLKLMKVSYSLSLHTKHI